MASGMTPPLISRHAIDEPLEPGRGMIFVVLGTALLFVFATRWPVARPQPFEYDEFGFLAQMASHWFPMHHTLFMTSGRLLGSSAAILIEASSCWTCSRARARSSSVWWMLRAIVRPATAAAAALLLGVGPVFWGYGAIGGNYTAIVLVGSFLLGVAYRGRSSSRGPGTRSPRPSCWRSARAIARTSARSGWRYFIVILWQHRWKRAIAAGLLFTGPQPGLALGDASRRRRLGSLPRRSARSMLTSAGYLNSIWHLGFVDAPVRYAVKLGMAPGLDARSGPVVCSGGHGGWSPGLKKAAVLWPQRSRHGAPRLLSAPCSGARGDPAPIAASTFRQPRYLVFLSPIRRPRRVASSGPLRSRRLRAFMTFRP